MRKVIGILPLLAGVVAAPAQAQDLGFGPRAEIRAGYDELNVGIISDDEPERGRQAENGLSIGGEVGFDVQVFGNMVAGVYAGADFSQIDDCDELFGDRGDELEEDELCLKGGRNLTAGGRIGIATGDGGLIYAKTGYSNARIRASYTDFVDVVEGRDDVGGWHFGGGFEVPLMGNVYVKGEYVHTSYGKVFSEDLGEGIEFRANRHQLLAGVGMRFGGRALAPPPPPPAPLPPPPAAPVAATKVCPDGSVVLETDPCPLPPPPPPPPPPMPGERG